MLAPSAVRSRQLNRSALGPTPRPGDDVRDRLQTVLSIILIKIKTSIARFKLAIQEVPAGYANEASQIIEEARIAGVYPELPPLTVRDPRTKTNFETIQNDRPTNLAVR